MNDIGSWRKIELHNSDCTITTKRENSFYCCIKHTEINCLFSLGASTSANG